MISPTLCHTPILSMTNRTCPEVWLKMDPNSSPLKPKLLELCGPSLPPPSSTSLLLLQWEVCQWLTRVYQTKSLPGFQSVSTLSWTVVCSYRIRFIFATNEDLRMPQQDRKVTFSFELKLLRYLPKWILFCSGKVGPIGPKSLVYFKSPFSKLTQCSVEHTQHMLA